MNKYYDAAIGRFINADAIGYLGANGNLNSYNLYAYCSNNPVMYTDPSGHAWYDTLWNWLNTINGVLNPTSKITALGSIVVAAADGRWDDIIFDWENGCLNLFNQSENIALKAKVVSFYKGSTIIKQNFVGTCSVFGTVWAESNTSSTILKHEYGHSIQEGFLGLSYLVSVAIPSVAYYWYDVKTNGSSQDYYSTPWERTADWLGGVNRGNYKTGSLAWGITENLFGPIIIPFYFAFGF